MGAAALRKRGAGAQEAQRQAPEAGAEGAHSKRRAA